MRKPATAPQNLTPQMLGMKRGTKIPASLQERLAKIPGRQRLAVANRHIPVIASNRDNVIEGIDGNATIIFDRLLSVKEKQGIDITVHPTPPSDIKAAFAEYAGELTKLIRKKQIVVHFTNTGIDMDGGQTGFKFQVVPDNRRMSVDRHKALVTVMNKIAAKLISTGNYASEKFIPIVGTQRPIGFHVNMLGSHLNNE
jgi:hypothetical protein